MNIKPMRYNVILEGDRNSKIDYLVKKLGTPSRNNAIGLCVDYCYDVMVKGKTISEAIPKLYYKDQIDVLKNEQKKISRDLFKCTDDNEKEKLRRRSKDIREQLMTAKEMYKFESDLEGTISDPVEKMKVAVSKEKNGLYKETMIRKLTIEVFKMQAELVRMGVNPEEANKFGNSILSLEVEDEYAKNIDTDDC